MLDRSGRSLIQILIGVTVAAVALGVFLKERAGKSDAAADPSTAADAAARPAGNPAGLDPAPYRAQIEQLEAVLYQPGQPDYSTGDRVQSLATDLGSAVMRTAPRTSQGGQLIMGFASRAGMESDVGYAAFDLAGARRRWEALRGDVFQPAIWFRGAAAGPAAAQTPAAAAQPAAPEQLLRSLETALNDVGFVIRTGRSNLQSIGEVGVDARPGTPEAQRIQQSFRLFATRWTDQINNIRREVPGLPPNADANLTRAWEEFDRLTRELNAIGTTSNPYGVPTRAERESRFRSAEALVENARGYLGRVGR